jgi:hypothetical protein
LDTSTNGTVDARPTKRFFVRMLVRDIELVPAIVDLVDNSVDGAKRLSERVKHDPDLKAQQANGNGSPLAGREVTLDITPERFVVKDDCGGIDLKDARDYAFRFGRLEDVESVEGEVGQFGVGMKRALFKLGNRFKIESVAANSRFVVEVDVDAWLQHPDEWTFPLRDPSEEPQPQESWGTTITVDQLSVSAAAEFGEERFQQRLRDQIEFRHQAALAAGLTIKLNGTTLRTREIGLLTNTQLLPRVVEKDLTAGDDVVHMRLMAGFAEIMDPNADTDDPDQFTGGASELAGWYVVCNDRMLLFADKSRLTGWGVEVADYHPQYRRFRGYVYLTGKASAMPWNTAKTAIDEDSQIWRLARREMVDALREARTIMNRIKSEVQDRPPDARPVSTQLDSAHTIPLNALEPSKTIIVPPRPPQQPPSSKRITYAVPPDQFEDAAAVLGVTAASDVGRGTFDYFYEREVDS